MVSYYVRWKGQVSGPFSLEQTQDQLKSGKISRYHELSIDQCSWKRPDSFSELTPPPPPMPVMPAVPPPPVEEEEEDEIACRCPHCKKKVFVAEKLLGTRVKCPKCEQKFMVQDEQKTDEYLSDRQMPGQSQFPSSMRTMFCRSCAMEISENAAMCPKCGTPTGNLSPFQAQASSKPPPKNRTAYVLLGLFFCGFGLHNFYIGHVGRGITKLILWILAWCFYFVAMEERSGANEAMGIAGLLFLFIGIWSLIEICTVKEDANGTPLQT